MEEKTTVVIDIQLDEQGVAERLAKVNAEMEDLKAQNRQLRKDVREGNKTWKDVSVQLADNEAKMKSLKAEQSALSGQVSQATQKTRAYGTSLKEQAALLSDLKNRYQSLTKEQRESAQGQELLKQIQDLDKGVKGADYSMGMFQRNVGNYKSALEGLAGGFRGAGVNVGFFGRAIQALKTGGPIVAGITAAITALTAAVKSLSKEYKQNEQAAMDLKEAMADMQVVTVGWRALWSSVADLFNTTVSVAVRGVTSALLGAQKAMQGFLNFFGANADFYDVNSKLISGLRNLTESQNRYVKAERSARVKISELEVEISDLRAKSVDKEKYTAEERLAFLDDAMEKEKKIAAVKMAMAKENLRILELSAAMAPNDTEANEKLTQAKVALNNAEKEYNETLRRLTRERNNVVKQLKDEKKGVDQVREAIELINLDSYEEKLRKAAEANKDLADSIKKVADRVGGLKTEMSGLQDSGRVSDYVEDIEEAAGEGPSLMEKLAASFTNNAKIIQDTASELGSSFGSLSDIYKTMAQDEAKSEEERAEAARKSQQWAKLQIAANSGTAMAKGIAGAMDAPFPANLGALATVISALLSAIAQAKALAAQGYSGGGPVGGFQDATMGPDNTFIHARRGEIMFNAKQQRELWEIANGGTPSSSLDARLAAALRNMPAPVLVYSELQKFSRNTVSITENQKLR